MDLPEADGTAMMLTNAQRATIVMSRQNVKTQLQDTHASVLPGMKEMVSDVIKFHNVTAAGMVPVVRRDLGVLSVNATLDILEMDMNALILTSVTA